MTDIATLLLQFLKLAPRYLVAVAIICGVLLWAGDSFLDVVDLRQFAQDNRQGIGFAFIASAVLFGVDLSAQICRLIRNRSLRTKAHCRTLQKLHSLTEEEKQILRFYLAEQSKTNKLRIDDGVVNGLVACHIIQRAASFGNVIEGVDHNISEFAWKYLHEHQELLDGSTTTYRTDRRRTC